MQYVIIGNGAAGSHAAKAIRQRDPNGVINVLSEEARPPYYRPMLDRLLADVVAEDKLLERGVKFTDADRIVVAPGAKVVQILPKERRACLDTGDRFPYDRLLVASGRHRDMPSVAGTELRGILQLRMLAGVARVNNLISAGATDAVVLGGGLGDMALAAALAKRGLKATFLSPHESVGHPVFCGDLCDLLARTLSEQGVRLLLGQELAHVSGADGRLESVEAGSGETIPCQILICARPLVPNVSPFVSSGLQMNEAIVVDAHMAGSVRDIWAAGGAAELAAPAPPFASPLGPTWEESAEQGRVAGANMAGATESYVPRVPVRRFYVHPVEVVTIGRNTPEDPVTDQVSVDHLGDGAMRQWVSRDGAVIGATLVGDAAAEAPIVEAVRAGSAWPL